ncbi:MAG: hypothetical protein HRT44_00035 [Bdellovibrionales bacterium]|nr:hypothetical protein [Bdellovibrionales bacterium]NQZ17646.1 hypothetical protein [Bdellovibrionales bacterium]
MKTTFDLSAIEKLLKNPKKLPKNIKESFLDWVLFVQYNGLNVAQKTKRFKDHALKGERKGQRSVYLNKQWRAIYEVNNGILTIIIVKEITPHDYRVK